MSFLRNKIRGMMQDPKERDNKERERTKEMYMRSLKLKNQWADSNKSDVFWKLKERTMLHNMDMDISGKDGKQNKYMATPTSRANSYESLIEIYKSKVNN